MCYEHVFSTLETWGLHGVTVNDTTNAFQLALVVGLRSNFKPRRDFASDVLFVILFPHEEEAEVVVRQLHIMSRDYDPQEQAEAPLRPEFEYTVAPERVLERIQDRLEGEQDKPQDGEELGQTKLGFCHYAGLAVSSELARKAFFESQRCYRYRAA